MAESRIRVSLLEEIRAELVALKENDLINPLVAQEDGDEMVGAAGLEPRRLYTLWQTNRRDLTEKLGALHVARTEEEKRRIDGEGQRLSEKNDILRDLFWAAVRDQFNLWNADHTIAVRTDFAIVLARKKKADPLLALFGGLKDN